MSNVLDLEIVELQADDREVSVLMRVPWGPHRGRHFQSAIRDRGRVKEMMRAGMCRHPRHLPGTWVRARVLGDFLDQGNRVHLHYMEPDKYERDYLSYTDYGPGGRYHDLLRSRWGAADHQDSRLRALDGDLPCGTRFRSG